MANRKEDQKNERIIRNLLKLSDNRRCINCNSLGPQYVCTNFWTFVCTACSGIHREFTHRVKSVSMATFTSQEVSALQEGGNSHAKQIYFKEWDPQRQSVPDSRNVEKLRDFIKHVYVDRRYTGEKSYDKPPRAKTGEGEESLDNKSGSKSPPYSNRPSPGGRSDDRDFRNSYDERRSPGFDRISPARTEIVNDWRREDRFGNLRKSDDGRISDGSTKLEERSPDRRQDSDMSSPPVVRPVRDILGDNVSPLRIIESPRIIEPPKANGGRGTDGSVHAQRTASSSSLASSNKNPTEIKNNTLGSLIDFDAAPDLPATAAVPQTQPTGSSQSVIPPTTSSSSDNWACFDSPPEKKATQAPSTLNTVDSLLSGLSVAAPVGNVTMFPPASAPAESPFGFGAFGVVQTNNSVYPTGNGMNKPAEVANVGQMTTMPRQQYSGFPASGVQSTSQPFLQQVGGPSSNQPWSSSIATVGQGVLNIPTGESTQAVARSGVEVAPAGVQKYFPPDFKPSGRHALPEDLFAPTYSYPVRTPAWQAGPPHGFMYNMQYNTPMPVQSFLQLSKSTNPFDFSNDLLHAPRVPSMATLQGTLPNVAAPTNTSQTSQAWMPSQSSYPSQSFASNMHPNAFMEQQMPNNIFPRSSGYLVIYGVIQGDLESEAFEREQGLGGEDAALRSVNPKQQYGGMFFPPATQNTFSTAGGNPFG